ncbi:MAG: diacylglycerol kinase family lipid kinase [Oscillospiraceae bacterium]
MKYLFIVNPVSGKRDAERVIVPKLKEWFKDKDYDWELVATQYPQHAKELALAAAQTGDPVRICACGGDGTLSEVVSGAFGYDNVEIAVYPCGSGNDFIKCFGAADDFQCIEEIVCAKSKPIDLLRVNEHICMNLISVGIDADVANAMNRYRGIPLLRGPLAYNLAVAECLLKPIGKNLRLKVGDEEKSGTFILAAIGNGRVYGGGYKATPEALVDDGIIDIVAVDKIPLMRIMKVLGIYKRGEHIKDGAVIEELQDCLKYYRTDRVEIDSDREFIVNIDGEIIRTSHVKIEMLHHKMKFVVPLLLSCAMSGQSARELAAVTD